ncbi:hypothetical protein ANTRET_LOCUS9574, partial [Anthophora retusa]
MSYSEEIYADLLSDVENSYDSDSDSDLDSGSDIVVRRFKNNGRPIISDSEEISDEEISVTDDWSEVDCEPDFHACLERSGLQKQIYIIIRRIIITTEMLQQKIKLGLTQTLQKKETITGLPTKDYIHLFSETQWHQTDFVNYGSIGTLAIMNIATIGLIK